MGACGLEILRQRTDRVGIFEDTIWQWHSETNQDFRGGTAIGLTGSRVIPEVVEDF